MLTNADCTIFENSGSPANWLISNRHIVKDVYWNDSRGQTVSKNGVQVNDSVIVYLYSDAYVPKAGDIIVKGAIGFKFDNSSQKSASESMRDFRTKHPDFAVIKSVNNCMYGGLPHIEVIAR